MKTIKIFSLLLISTICFSGCSNDDDNDKITDMGNNSILLERNGNKFYFTFTPYTIDNAVTLNPLPKDIASTYENDIDIPGSFEYNGRTYLTVFIGSAFQNSNISSVNIPNTVEFIHESAFSECKQLKSVTIPGSVRTIGDNVFSGCINLTTFSIPDNVYAIGNNLFKDCKNLTDITLSNSLHSISKEAFSGCENLKSISIPSNITSIEQYAFKNTGFTSFTIPNHVTKIEGGVFQNCKKLENVIIPEHIERIPDLFLMGCENIKSYEIPGHIKGIGRLAFSNSGITSISIPDHVTDIEFEVFANCQELISAHISSANITTDMFKNCTKLNTVKLDATIKNIYPYAFWGCTNLTSIELPNSIQGIYEQVFTESGLQSITIPDKVFLDHQAFSGCNNLETVKFEGKIETLYGHIGNFFANCENLKTVIFENDFGGIYESMFINCKNLKTLDFSTIKGIGDEAFMATGFETLTLSEFNTHIGKKAFKDCRNLTSLYLPATVEVIEKEAFYDCDALKNIYAYPKSPVNSTDLIFNTYTATLHVPVGSKEIYQKSEQWAQFKNIVEDL